MFTNRATSVAATVLSILAVVWLWLAIADTRPLDGDALCFVPVAHNLANGKGWINQHYRPDKVVTPDHPENFTWHGYTSPYLWASLAPSKDYSGIRMGGTFSSILGLLMMSVFLFQITWASNRAVICVASAFLLLGMSPFLLHNGRPEPVAASVLLLVLCGARFCPQAWRVYVIGVGMGLLGLTHPVIALLCTPLVAVFFTLQTKNWKDLLLTSAQSLLAALGTLGLLLLLTPYSVSDWLVGMYYHAQGAIVRETEASMLYYWMKLPDRPFFALSTLACVSPLIHFAFTSVAGVRKVLLGILSFVFFLLVWYFAVRVSTRSYNVAALLPALACISFLVCTLKKNLGIRFSPFTIPLYLAFMSAIPGVFVNIRHAALAGFAQSHQADRLQASRQILASIQELKMEDSNTQVSVGLFEITDILPNSITGMFNDPPVRNFYILQQSSTSRLLPPDIRGYRLAQDDYIHYPPRLGPIRLGNSSPGYSFAIYEKVRDVPKF